MILLKFAISNSKIDYLSKTIHNGINLIQKKIFLNEIKNTCAPISFTLYIGIYYCIQNDCTVLAQFLKR